MYPTARMQVLHVRRIVMSIRGIVGLPNAHGMAFQIVRLGQNARLHMHTFRQANAKERSERLRTLRTTEISCISSRRGKIALFLCTEDDSAKELAMAQAERLNVTNGYAQEESLWTVTPDGQKSAPASIFVSSMSSQSWQRWWVAFPLV